MVTSVLQQIGFTPNEAAVYVALLTLERGTTIQTAKQANLSRTTTYDVLRSLLRKGVIVEISDKKRKVFAVESLDMLSGFLEKRELELIQGKQALHNIRLELEHLRYPFKALPKVRLHEGTTEVKAHLTNLFVAHTNTELSFVCTDHFMRNHFSVLEEFHNLRSKQGIQANILVHDTNIKGSIPTSSTKQLLNIRTLEEGHRYDAAMHIIGNTVGFWSAKSNLVVVQMESDDISSLHHQVFLDLWAKALLQ